jgi:hypothetical protein
MNRLLLLFVLLLGCATPTPGSYQQATAVRPAPRPPVYTPGYAPGTSAEPTYTPQGAGASHGGLPGSSSSVPRSPNKRILPATKEPGLWAADGAPSASRNTTPRILKFELAPPVSLSNTFGTLVAKCMSEVHTLVSNPPFTAPLKGMDEKDAKCLGGHLAQQCVNYLGWLLREVAKENGVGVESLLKADMGRYEKSVRAQVEAVCKDRPEQEATERLVKMVFDEYRRRIQEAP